jgi:transposase
MANVLKVNEQNTIQQLAAQGWSRRRIARELRVDRKTVRRYLAATPKSPTISPPGSPAVVESKPPISTPGDRAVVEGSPTSPNPEPGRPSFCDPYREPITAKLEAGLSAQRIYQDLVAEFGFAGSYQSVKRFVRQLRHDQPERIWRIEVQPGEEVQVDFGTGAPVLSQDGHRRRPWVLRVVLSYSRKAYSEAVFHQTTENLIRCLENAWRSLGGVTKILNLDNMRAAVQKADWCDPDLNPKLLSFCRHYGCALLPCRPRTPEHKGKTERGIGFIKGNALRGRTFPRPNGNMRVVRERQRGSAMGTIWVTLHFKTTLGIGTIATQRSSPRAVILNMVAVISRPILWGRSYPIHGVCMTCTGTCVNGVGTGMEAFLAGV